MVKIGHKDTFMAVLVSATFIYFAWVIGQNWIAVVCTAAAMGCFIWMDWQKRWVFDDQQIIFKDSVFRKEIKTSYSTLQSVHIVKPLLTKHFHLYFKCTFMIDGIVRKTTISLQEYRTAGKIVRILKQKEIPYTYSNDYAEMLIERESLLP